MGNKPPVQYLCPFCDAVNYAPQGEWAGNCTTCGKPYPRNQDPIEKAVLKERERCAKIVEQFAAYERKLDRSMDDSTAEQLDRIAEAIRDPLP